MTREDFIKHVESNQRAFRRFLTALCSGDSALADDIAQESLLKAYLSCDDFRDSDKFNAWIYRIGYNTFLNHRRSVRTTVGYEDVSHVAADLNADSQFRYEHLYEALTKLPENERMAILLFYMEDYATKEIAEIVGVSEPAVRQYLSRGRAHLRGLLKD